MTAPFTQHDLRRQHRTMWPETSRRPRWTSPRSPVCPGGGLLARL